MKIFTVPAVVLAGALLVLFTAVQGPERPDSRWVRENVSLPSPVLLDVEPAAATDAQLSPGLVHPAPRAVVSEPHSAPSAPRVVDVDPNSVVQGTCTRCHSDRRMTGNLSLETFDIDALEANAEVAERMVRKLRAGMMPPPGARTPSPDTMLALVEALEGALDDRAAQNPDPGHRSFQRLNRPEYQRAVLDFLGLHVDAGDWLPLDQKSANFDNIADAQALSPTLLESYLNAAADISRMALGNPEAAPNEVPYKNSQYVSQHPWDHVEGAPYGTRGGIVVEHVFPADGEYVFSMAFASGDNEPFEDVDVSIDGERVALVAHTQQGVGADGRGAAPVKTEPVFVRAGQHRVSAAFVRRFDGPYEDLIRPHDWSFAGGGSGGGGITTLPHLNQLLVGGPYNVTGVSESESRRRIFTCRPTVAAEELPCATEILTRLASDAYRRPATDREMAGLMDFYREGAAQHGFEAGIRTSLEAILASPFFVLRLERQPEDVAAGENFRLAGEDLASRLSFFLWGAPPDAELLELARAGELNKPETLREQARRMLADERADALGVRFAAQWLRLQDLYKVRPDPNFFPDFDENLADAMHTETELFFNSLVDNDESVLELFTADYTFVNERLARHYGFSGVSGSDFRRIQYPEGTPRQGLLGQGSVLVLTSMANRTSPVLRGKWVMEVLMGTPPPPPPPGVPELEETDASKDGRFLTTRERMEMHRANPTCNSCHRFMDPIGLALDNFDVTGKWRIRENGIPLDTRGDFYDGSPVSTPAELADALMGRPIPLVRNFTENLMAYALGRRVEAYDQPTVRAIVREAEGDEYKVSSLILGVVTSDAFRMKRATPAIAADAPVSESN